MRWKNGYWDLIKLQEQAMNEDLQNYARSEIKQALAECTEEQRKQFKQIYAYYNVDLSISDVVNDIQDDKLECALDLCERNLLNNKLNALEPGCKYRSTHSCREEKRCWKMKMADLCKDNKGCEERKSYEY